MDKSLALELHFGKQARIQVLAFATGVTVIIFAHQTRETALDHCGLVGQLTIPAIAPWRWLQNNLGREAMRTGLAISFLVDWRGWRGKRAHERNTRRIPPSRVIRLV